MEREKERNMGSEPNGPMEGLDGHLRCETT
jgi:hypothetical protein